jgi:8-oxo-dGTP diphosphatase
MQENLPFRFTELRVLSAPSMTVVAALARSRGRIFLARRAAGLRDGGLWELPGGKQESGETPREAIAREVREELDIGVCNMESEGRSYRIPTAKGEVLFIVFGLTFDSEPAPGPAHDAVAWVGPEEIRDYSLAPLDAAPIADWIAEIRGSDPGSSVS